MKYTLSIFAAAVLLAIPSTNAAIVFGNLGSDGSGSVAAIDGSAVSATDWVAQGFTTGGASTLLDVDSITLGLRNNSGNTISASVSIWSDSGGSPFASLYTSSAVNIPNANGAKYTFSFGAAPLNVGTSYWVVMSTPNLTWSYQSGNLAPTGLNSSGYVYTATKSTADSGLNWGNSFFSSQAISMVATEAQPIPEPGTWAAAVLLAGGAAYARWRKRKA